MSSLTDEKGSSHKSDVLLVEDNAIIQKVHRLKLENLGYLVDSATTGIEALIMYNKNKYSIILLDWGLPDIDGIEVCMHIRLNETYNNKKPVPIIMVSAYPRETLKSEHKSAGFNEFVIKPIPDDQALQALLLRWLSI